MAKAPFVIRDDLTAITLGYKNKAMIADSVLPRVPVMKEEFRYTVLNRDEQFRIPDTKVGRTGRTNEIEFGATQETSFTEDYGLEDPIPQKDIDNADTTYNPESTATEQLTDLIALDREKRTAALVFNPANYGASNKTTLSGTAQWSDFVNSNPIGDLLEARESMIMDANIAVIGSQVFAKLRQHPQIAKAVHGNSGDSAVVARQALAELLEVEEVIIGAAFLDLTKKGQTASLSRVWGKHFAFIHRNRQATTNRLVTFGITAQFGSRVSGEIIDPNIGLRGGKRIRVGESVRELILAADAGYIFENAIA